MIINNSTGLKRLSLSAHNACHIIRIMRVCANALEMKPVVGS